MESSRWGSNCFVTAIEIQEILACEDLLKNVNFAAFDLSRETLQRVKSRTHLLCCTAGVTSMEESSQEYRKDEKTTGERDQVNTERERTEGATSGHSSKQISVCACVCVCLPKTNQAGMKNEEALKKPGAQNTHTLTHTRALWNSWWNLSLRLFCVTRLLGWNALTICLQKHNN